MVDIVLNFRTSFVKKNGQVCYDSRLIALYYIRGWFLLDLLAAIPFDLLYAFDVDTVSCFTMYFLYAVYIRFLTMLEYM